MLSSSILLFTFVKYLNTAFENSSPWIYFVSSQPEFVKSIPKFLTFFTVKTNSWNKVSWKDWCLLILCLCIVTTKISVVRGRLYYSGAGKWWSMGWCSHYWDLNCSSHWNYLILIQLVPSITTHLARYCCWYIWDRIVSLGWDQTGIYYMKSHGPRVVFRTRVSNTWIESENTTNETIIHDPQGSVLWFHELYFMIQWMFLKPWFKIPQVGHGIFDLHNNCNPNTLCGELYLENVFMKTH